MSKRNVCLTFFLVSRYSSLGMKCAQLFFILKQRCLLLETLGGKQRIIFNIVFEIKLTKILEYLYSLLEIYLNRILVFTKID